MIEYPKIETLYSRLPGAKKAKVDVTRIRLPEFSLVKRWTIYEKIDGTNVRIVWSREGGLSFASRYYEKVVQLTPELQQYLSVTFTLEKFEQAFPKVDAEEVQLFGEGYGANVDSSSGAYRGNPAFRLFDVYIGGWWLEPENIDDIAGKMGVRTAPRLSNIVSLPASTADMNDIIPEGRSIVADEDGGDPKFRAEGIVARTSPLLFTRKGDRLMWKLKYKDF